MQYFFYSSTKVPSKSVLPNAGFPSECLRSFILKKKMNNNESKTQMPRFFVQRFWLQHVWSGGWDSCAPEHYHLKSTPGCCSIQTNLETIVPNEEGANIYCNKCRGMGFPGGLVVKNLLSNAGDMCSIPGCGIPGEGKGNPFQYSCLGNLMDSGAWQATVHGVTKESDTTEWLITHRSIGR